MAGDLLIISMESDELDALTTVLGGQLENIIHHADRDTLQAWQNLDARSRIFQPPRVRQELPPHMYIRFTFNQLNQNLNQMQTAKLKNLMMKITRPLGIVSAQQVLNDWQNQDGCGRLQTLIQATNNHAIVLEFYKIGGTPVLIKFPRAMRQNENT